MLRRAKELLHKEIDSLEPSDEKPKEEGLLGMKFMQQALERKRQESKRFADATLAEFDDLEGNVTSIFLSATLEMFFLLAQLWCVMKRIVTKRRCLMLSIARGGKNPTSNLNPKSIRKKTCL